MGGKLLAQGLVDRGHADPGSYVYHCSLPFISQTFYTVLKIFHAFRCNYRKDTK